MRLEVPQRILLSLRKLGIAPERNLFSVKTDINARGLNEVQWLVLTSETLYIFGESGREPIRVLPLREIGGFRTSPNVGSGLLQALIDGVWVDLLRFSNRLKFLFDSSLKAMEGIRTGEIATPVSVSGVKDPQRCPKCGLMLEFAGETCPRCIDHGAAVTRVMSMIRPYWRTAGLLMVLLFFGIALDMVWPLLTRFLVDYVLVSPRPEFSPAFRGLSRFDSHTLLLFVVGALASIHVVRAGLNMVTTRLSSWVGNMMTFQIRSQLVSKLEKLGLAYYSKQETGSLVGRVAYDTESIQGFISQITSGFVMQFLLVIFSFMMMFALEPGLALWSMVPAPFVIGGAFWYWRHVHPRYQRYWDRTSKQAGLLNGILTGIRVVKSFAKEEYELSRFENASHSVRTSKDSLDRMGAFFYPTMGIVFQIGGWIIWYVGGLSVLKTEISLGTLMAFFGYLSMFYGPLGNLTNLTTWLTQFSTQVHRIIEILDAPTVIPEAAEPEPLPAVTGRVEFRDVVFSYTRGNPVLRGVSLEFKPGEQIGIVGRSGSGKTSLINLIYRFYDVDSGEILLDGVNIRNLSYNDLRQQISIVLQEPFLFHGTLMENIAYGQPGAAPSAVIEASRASSSHDFVMAHHLAYETSVGERGQELSGGERQRISIARALLRASPILILDEATSAIDSESELSIQSALEDVAKSRTTIIIAHRLSTLQNCDRIYVLENGEIAETGSHLELMRKQGLYARWVRMQQGESYVEMNQAGKVIRPRPSLSSETGLPGIDSHLTRWLHPDVAQITRGSHGELRVEVAGEPVYRGVFALRCFPVSFPESYISLRFTDDHGRIRELGIMRELSEWTEQARALVRDSLAQHYLFHRVDRIYNIRKFSNFLAFSTRTHLGKVEFVVRYSHDAVKKYGSHGRLLMDIEDNLYLIPDVKHLTRNDRAVFERFVYW